LTPSRPKIFKRIVLVLGASSCGIGIFHNKALPASILFPRNDCGTLYHILDFRNRIVFRSQAKKAQKEEVVFS
jgi:hypothetical protein